MIEEFDHKGFKLAALTRDNVVIVEAMIRNDSAYIRSSDKTAKPVFDKNGNEYGDLLDSVASVRFEPPKTVRRSH